MIRLLVPPLVACAPLRPRPVAISEGVPVALAPQNGANFTQLPCLEFLSNTALW